MYLHTVSRLIANRSAISRFECDGYVEGKGFIDFGCWALSVNFAATGFNTTHRPPLRRSLFALKHSKLRQPDVGRAFLHSGDRELDPGGGFGGEGDFQAFGGCVG